MPASARRWASSPRPVSYELVRSRYMRLDAFDAAVGTELLKEMSAEAAALVVPGARGLATFERRMAFMRYVGQGHEITVELPQRPLEASDAEALREAYERDYAALFERHIPNAAIEILSWSVQVSTESKLPAVQGAAPKVPAPLPVGKRPVFDGRSGRTTQVPVYRRESLPPGSAFAGPAIVAEDETSTYVSASFAAHIDASGCIVMDRKDALRRTMSQSNSVGLIDLQIMWNRLIAVVEEQAQTLMRTAFSPIVRECGDLSAGVFDLEGRMLAQAVTGTPGHVNSMAESVKHFLRHFPIGTMKAGDAYITNDPWMGTGHLNDFVITTPCFRNGKPVALFSCTSHLMDIGGIGFGPDATDVFMEGLYIPMLKLIDQGKVNETLMAMIRANTRQPVDTEGDVYSLAACNDVGARRLVEMMDEFGIDTLDDLGDHIIARSREAVLAEIAKLPKGTWHNAMTVGRLRRAGHPEGRPHHLRQRHPCRLHRHVEPRPAAASTCRMPTPRPTPSSAWAAWWPRTFPTMRARSSRSPCRRPRARS